MYESDDSATIVIDNGTSQIRAGFAKADPENSSDNVSKPQVIIPAVVSEDEDFIGDEALRRCRAKDLVHPIKNGIIDKMDYMEKVWKYIFKRLDIDAKDHPILMTEAVNNIKSVRERTAQTLFETFKVPALHLSPRPSLALFNSGRVTGLVLESGFSATHTVPVYEGHTLPYATQSLNIGGEQVSSYLLQLLSHQDRSLYNDYQSRIDDIKKQMCYVASDYKLELSLRQFTKHGNNNYLLPDGREVPVNEARIQCPEALFDEGLLTPDMKGFHELCNSSITKCDKDIHAELYKNIVMCGGNTLFPGLGDRLKKEIESLVITSAARKRNISVVGLPQEGERQCHESLHSVWMGGALIASLSKFPPTLVTRQEYDEYGKPIVHKKCF